jgi:hypothetical protein
MNSSECGGYAEVLLPPPSGLIRIEGSGAGAPLFNFFLADRFIGQNKIKRAGYSLKIERPAL